jgi:uncharacterized protein (TIGR02996 family)
MTQRDALLRAVCDNPDDDLPRLVFADWCDENGEPERAEFIRTQIELRKADVPAAGRAKLGLREGSLLSLWERRWKGELVSEPGLLWGWFERGFVERLSVYDPDPFFANLDALFDWTPLRKLTIGGRVDLRPLIASPYFTRVESLVLEPKAEVTWESLRALYAVAPAPHLTLLMVAHRREIAPALEHLAAAYGDRFTLWGE